jgi:hypothetical protein
MAISSISLRIYPEILRSLDSATLSNIYMGIGTPLSFPARIIMFQNTTDVDVLISWDGINDHQIIPAGSFTLLDVATNKVNTQGWYVGAQQRFYAKEAGTPSTLGAVYLTTFYGLSEEV